MDGVGPAAPARPAAYLVDGSLYVFRAWHSLPSTLVDADGYPSNAVHGYARFLCELLERTQAELIAVAFDASLTSSFRNLIYPSYKANRELPPPELERQFRHCRALTVALGIRVLIDHSYEADDLIGSTAWSMRALGVRSVIVSADKDFGQLLGTTDEQWDYARGLRYGPDGVLARLGVQPQQVADYLALCGDAADNIPGVPGIGAKTAAALLGHFGSLEQLLARIDEVPTLRLRGAAACAAQLRAHAEQARLYRSLTRIAMEAPGAADTQALQRGPSEPGALDALCGQLRLSPLLHNRLEALRR